MEPSEVIRHARAIVSEAGYVGSDLAVSTALDFFDTVREVLKTWPRARQQETPWLKDFAESLRKLRDDFQAIVAADPACVYQPAHAVATQFHQSNARVRYYFGGNRISKTQAGYVDDYWVMTGQHPWRARSPLPASVFIIGTNFTKYAPGVFEAKWVYGEPGNPLSPLFPEGGKYFNHYDERKKRLLIGCPECVAKGKPKECRHARSSVTLFSDREGAGVLAGAQYAQGHLDEQIQREFFSEGMERLKTVPNSGLIITETPLFGKAWWTYQEVFVMGKSKELNLIPGTDKKIVSLHTISQYDAGLVTKEQIDLTAAAYTETERRARIFGEHVVDNEGMVFDAVELSHMRNEVRPAELGYLVLERELAGEDPEELLRGEVKSADVLFQPDPRSQLKIWEHPDPFEQYVIGVDVAKGLTKRDASCANVFRVRLEGSYFKFALVAQYHGWINPDPYAEILFKLGLYYGCAPLVIERNGPGDSVIYQLVNRLHCWFLLRDVQNVAQIRVGMNTLYGVDTNVTTKGMMISLLQQTIKDTHSARRCMEIWDEDTLGEFESYIQEVTESGQTYKFRGIGNAHDDRVMAAAVAVYAIKTFPDAFDVDKASANERARRSGTAGIDSETKTFWRNVREDLRKSSKQDPLDP